MHEVYTHVRTAQRMHGARKQVHVGLTMLACVHMAGDAWGTHAYAHKAGGARNTHASVHRADGA